MAHVMESKLNKVKLFWFMLLVILSSISAVFTADEMVDVNDFAYVCYVCFYIFSYIVIGVTIYHIFTPILKWLHDE